MNFDIGHLPYTYTLSTPSIAAIGGVSSESSDMIIDKLEADWFLKAQKGLSSRQYQIFQEQFRKLASQCKQDILCLQGMLISKEETILQTNESNNQLLRAVANLYENCSRDQECMRQVEAERGDLASRIRAFASSPQVEAQAIQAVPERRPALDLSSHVPSIFGDDTPVAPVPTFLQQLGRDSRVYRRTRVEEHMVAANMLASAVSGAGQVAEAVIHYGVKAVCERNELTKRACKVAKKIVSGINEPIIETGRVILKESGIQNVIDHAQSSWEYGSRHHLPELYEKELGIPREETISFVQSTEILAKAVTSSIKGRSEKVVKQSLFNLN